MSLPISGLSSDLKISIINTKLAPDQVSGAGYHQVIPYFNELTSKTNQLGISSITSINKEIIVANELSCSTQAFVIKDDQEQDGCGTKRKKKPTQEHPVTNDSVDGETTHNEVKLTKKKSRFGNYESKKKTISIQFRDKILSLGQVLGQGTFGSVFEAQESCANFKASQVVFAVKVNNSKSKSGIKTIEHEGSLLKHLSSHGSENGFIVSLLGEYKEGKSSYLIFPKYISDLRVESRISHTDLRRTSLLAGQLFSALSFLQEFTPPIIHCDVKPENIFVEVLDPLKIRLGDFGASKDSPYENTDRDYLVTRWYRPPEVILGFVLTTAVDMWSAACVIYGYQAKSRLFHSETELDLMKDIHSLIGPLSCEYFNKIKDIPIPISYIQYCIPDNHSDLGEKAPLLPAHLDRNIVFKGSSQISSSEPSAHEHICVELFKQMLTSILCWNPSERTLAKIAKLHPFFAKISEQI
ncbi:MAG: serine/threonine-protein kinase [Chlamydiae bacterium]|nr:serine/threonine-protein kinase [Chlamydiota bacterium]